MAASEILGLFTSPQQYQQNQLAQFQNRAALEVQLSPFQQAALGARTAGYQLGQGVGGALGGQDPQLQLIARRQALASQLDQADPASYMRVAQLAAQSGDPQFAMSIADAGRQMQSSMATARKATAEAEKVELTNAQEAKLRSELSKLVNPTEAEILAIVTKYGSPDKVLTSLTTSADKALQRENTATLEREKIQARSDIEKDRIQAQKDRDLERATSQKERDEAERKFEERMKQLDRDSKEALVRIAGSLRQPPAPALTTIQNPDNPSETITVDARIYQGGGKGSAGVIGAGKPSAAQEKASLLKTQMGKDLNTAIAELEDITKDGGLIDQSTGSGAGRLVDVGAGFFGKATEGAIAIGKLKPIQDLALKMVPRFEGPQSDKDTQSYKEAAGQLADPTLPTKIRKEAGKTVLRLMKERKNQFVTPELAAEGVQPSPSPRQLSVEDKKALDWANSNPSDPRAAQIKQKLGL
jgi:hypothetical protein